MKLELQEAVSQLKAAGNMFKAIIELSEKVDSLSVIENYESELLARKDQKLKEIVEVESKLSEVDLKLQAANEALNDILRSHEAAKLEADAALKSKMEQGEAFLAELREKGDVLCGEYDEKINAAKAQHEALLASCVAASKELEETKAKIEEVKANMRQALGG